MDKRDLKLVKKGWASMQAKLDREMPANPRRKRRPVAWMWLMGVFLLTLAGIKDWQQYQQSKRVILPPVDNKEMDTSIAATPGVEKESSAPVETIGKKDPDMDPQMPQIGQNLKTNNASRANGLPAVSQGTRTSLAIVPMAPKDIERTNPGIQDRLATATEPSVEAIQAIRKTDDLAVIPVLPAAVALQTETETPEPQSLDLPIQLRPNSTLPKPWTFAVNGGVSTERFVAVNGLSAGMSLIWQPLRRLGIRAGASYQTERPTAQSRPIANVSAKNFNSYLFNSLDIIGTNAKNLYVDPSEEVLIPVRRLHQIEFPALIFWQPWQQWRLYSGSTLTRTLYAKSGRYSYVSNQNQDPFSVLEETKSLDELASRQLRTWHIYGNSGIGFMPWERWEIDFFGQFELPGLRKASENARYNTSVSEAFSSTSSTKPVYTRFQLSATLFF